MAADPPEPALGPLQVIAVEFDSLDGFEGRILDEIELLTAEAAARVLDILVVIKEVNGDLVVAELDDGDLPTFDEAIGTLLGELMGFEVAGASTSPPGDDLAEASRGVGVAEIQALAETLAPGSAVGLMLIEHRWAIGLRSVIRGAGGRFVLQGFLSPEGVLMIGAEAAAVSNAIDAIELAEAAEAEATVRTIEAAAVAELATEVEATVVARTIRTLVEAGVVQRAAVGDAIEAVLDAALVSEILDREASS